MNVCLQCLANTKCIKEYILNTEIWRNHLNFSNAMSRRGELIGAFAELLKEMWMPSESSVRPEKFKQVVGQFKEEFRGRQQQDAQEFLTFLIDGLHEETNLALDKPYMDLSESTNKTMEDAADKCWSFNLLRNWSLFSFMFTGLLGSELVCKNCKNKSWSFEPFMSLSLPIDMTMDEPINIVLVPLLLNDPSYLLISLLTNKGDTINTLIDNIYALKNIGLKKRASDIELVFAEVVDNRVIKVLEPKTEVKRLEQLSKNKELYVFETILKNPNNKSIEELDIDENSIKSSKTYIVDNKYIAYNNTGGYNPAIKEYKKSKVDGTDYFIHAYNRVITHDDAFTWKRYDPLLKGNPMLISLNTKMTHLDLYDQAWKAVVRYLQPNSKYTFIDACWWRKYRRVNVQREARQPFIIRLVNKMGIACSKCNWREQCLGCSIMPEQREITINPADYISLDWYLDTFEEDYRSIKKIKEHESFIQTKEVSQRSLNLKEIFKKFTMPENLASAKCEVCNEMAEHKKTLSFSRFPIILILHLKRYNEK